MVDILAVGVYLIPSRWSMDDEQPPRLYPIHRGRKPDPRPSARRNCADIIIAGRPVVVDLAHLALLGIAARARDIIMEEISRWNGGNYGSNSCHEMHAVVSYRICIVSYRIVSYQCLIILNP
mmetsp:Transcript_10991/g.19438  ORF Transcript_10991/g.19438 Transcript_10991/m.19438 type:complete len:122 (-) Transcript_10991:146-511(-)